VPHGVDTIPVDAVFTGDIGDDATHKAHVIDPLPCCRATAIAAVPRLRSTAAIGQAADALRIDDDESVRGR
jgi:hypothetical protein